MPYQSTDSFGPNVIPETRSLLQTSLIQAIFYFLIWTMWPLAIRQASRGSASASLVVTNRDKV
jgi:hypothetical protein